METNRLLQFQVLAKTKNLREAATYLRMSHPGLWKSIRKLEEELGVELTIQEGRGIKITKAGLDLLDHMTNCLDAQRRLLSAAEGIQVNSPKPIRIGTFEVFSTYLSALLVRELEPETPITFDELIPGKLEEALVAGRVDVGITYLPIPSSQVEHVQIRQIQMGLFSGIGAEWIHFKEYPFVVPLSQVEGSPTKVRGLDGWPDDRIPRNVKYSVSMMETAITLLRESLAVAYLPKFIVELHNRVVQPQFKLKELPLPKGREDHTRPIFAAKNKSSKEDKIFRSISRVLRSLR